MGVTFYNLPSTPTLPGRHVAFLEESPVCTRKEMCQKNPNKCRRMNKSTVMCALRNTAPGRLGRNRNLPFMDNPDAHAVSFFHDSDKDGSAFKETLLGREYFESTFKVVRVLGCGSFGMVLNMVSKKDDKQYAIKTLAQYQSQSDRNRKWREVAFLEFIDHPNCLQFHFAWEEQDKLYIQTELCKCTLQEYINEVDGDVPEHVVLDILVDTLMGLSYLHSNRIVHLDVKPENILLTENGIAKLADFGIAFCLDYDDPEDCIVEGEPRYLAHEALDDGSEFRVSSKRDIYSLGICILQLTTDLVIPNDVEKLMHFRKLELPSHIYLRIPRKLSVLIPKMLADDPNERPEAEKILQMESIRNDVRERSAFVEQNTVKRRDKKLDFTSMHQALAEAARDKSAGKSRSKRVKAGSKPNVLDF